MFRKNFLKRDTNYLDYHKEIGFEYGSTLSPDNTPYWAEGAAYEFTLDEVEVIEAATERLHEMCMNTVRKIIESGDYPKEFRLEDQAKSAIEQSWRANDLHVYGRFDFMVNQAGDVKLFEYNADTPTSLLEAGVAQWQWTQDVVGIPNRDQFNSIHDKLIARWKMIRLGTGTEHPFLYLTASKKFGSTEDWGNLHYMADTAVQAGWNIQIIEMETIGHDKNHKLFLDATQTPIEYIFKLHPWEWMMEDVYAPLSTTCPTVWFEPAWKMLLSNKAILPMLWALYPNHPNLLPAFYENDTPAINTNLMVKKPIIGREGANIILSDTFGESLIAGSHQIDEFDEYGYIFQEYAPLPDFNGKHPVIGSWVIGDEAAGIGIREDDTLISGNGSHFVPHYFVD
jgi:glutathionylspermidine synthase